MERQANVRPFEPTDLFADGRAARPIPAHVVAHAMVPPDRAILTGERGGRPVADIPLPVTRELLERGRDRFTIYCAVCHGDDGYGRGIVVRRGFPEPPSYHDARLRQAPAGHFFQVITQGYGKMYPYAGQLVPADRWAIVAYIRALQRSQHASIRDVPSEERRNLASP